MRFDLEGHRPAITQIDHAGVFAQANQHVLHFLGGFLTELAQVHFGGLIRSVLDHIDEYMANSASVGRRLRISRMREYSCSLSS